MNRGECKESAKRERARGEEREIRYIKIYHKSQHKICIPLSSKDSSLPWLLSDFFFQGEKGDTGLRGLDGNAGVKVDTTVLVT